MRSDPSESFTERLAREHGLGRSLSEMVCPDGRTVALHRRQATGSLWLLEELTTDEDGSASGGASPGLVATTLIDELLIVGGIVGAQVVGVEISFAGEPRFKKVSIAERGAWLTYLEDAVRPFDLCVRELDAADREARRHKLDFSGDLPSSWRDRLRAWELRVRPALGWLPKGSTAYAPQDARRQRRRGRRAHNGE
jgi:hypothetical protein